MGVVWGQNRAYFVVCYGACYQGMGPGRRSILRRHVDWCIKLDNFVKSLRSEGKVACKFVELWWVRPKERLHHWDRIWSSVLEKASIIEASLILTRGQYMVSNDRRVIGNTSEKLKWANSKVERLGGATYEEFMGKQYTRGQCQETTSLRQA